MSKSKVVPDIRKQKFAREYVMTGVRYKSAIRAGYDPNGASTKSSHLMNDPEVIKFIDIYRKELNKKYDVTTNRIMNELCYIAFGDTSEFFSGRVILDINDMPSDVSRAIAEVTVKTIPSRDGIEDEVEVIKIKGYDKLKALDMLAKMIGAYERDNAQKIPIIINPFSKEVPFTEEVIDTKEI